MNIVASMGQHGSNYLAESGGRGQGARGVERIRARRCVCVRVQRDTTVCVRVRAGFENDFYCSIPEYVKP